MTVRRYGPDFDNLRVEKPALLLGTIDARGDTRRDASQRAISPRGTIATEQLVGEITETQIADDAISTPKIQANAIKAQHIDVATLSAISADLGEIVAGLARDSNSKFVVDFDNALLTVLDAQATPQTRVKLGRLGAGTTNYGLEIYSAAGALILGASGLGTNTVDTAQLVDGAVTVGKMSVTQLSAITANLGTVTAGIARDANSNFVINFNNSLLTVVDTQGTPRTRIRLGKLGAGAADYGLEIRDANNNLVFDANGLGVNVVGNVQIQNGVITFSKLIPGSFDNLASNPGFETGLTTPHNFVNAGGAWTLVNTGARTGTYAARYDSAGQTTTARIDINGGLNIPANHHIITEGQAVYAEAYAKRESASTANRVRLRLDWRDASGLNISTQTGTPLTLTDSYEKFSIVGVAPAGTAYFAIRVEVINDGNSTPILVDDVYIRIMVTGDLITDGAVITSKLADGAAIASKLTESSKGFSTDITFSATDFNTVAWTAGTLRFADGTTASISSGNTGNMSALTYIYYNPDVSTTALQTTTNYVNATGERRVLLAVAKPAPANNQNAFFVSAVGVFGLNSEQLSFNSISANHLQANSVQAAHINVVSLDAISANMGTLTAGVARNSTNTFIVDFNNSLLTVIDSQGTPRTRVRVGKLGTDAEDWGIEVHDASGNNILSATGLGLRVVGSEQISSGVARKVDDRVISGPDADGVVNVTFTNPFDNVPTVILIPHLVQTYESTVSADQWFRLQATNITNTGFTLIAQIVEPGSLTAQSDDFPTSNSVTAAGTWTEATLNPGGAASDSYTVHFNVSVTADARKPGGGVNTAVLVVAIDTDAGSGFVERATYVYSATSDVVGFPETVNYTHEQKTITVSGLGSGAKIRIRAKSFSAPAAGGSFVIHGYDSTDVAHGVTYQTMTGETTRSAIPTAVDGVRMIAMETA